METHVDDKTRNNLAYLWSIAVILIVAYIVIVFGKEKEILTLIIGFITGTASTILALYFGGVLSKKQPTNPGETTAEINASITTTEDGDKE